MKSGRYWHYWDSCIFMHWFSDPKKDAAVVDGIEEIVRQVERGEAGVMTSVITRIEVLNCKMEKEYVERFFKLFSRPSMQQVNVDPRVAQLAHDIRDHYASLAKPVKLWTPDCIHLATAIIYEADEMNTLDGAGKRRRPSDLVSLSGSVMGQHKLTIRKPLRQQGSILAGAKPLEIAKKTSEETEPQSASQNPLRFRRNVEGVSANSAAAKDEEGE